MWMYVQFTYINLRSHLAVTLFVSIFDVLNFQSQVEKQSDKYAKISEYQMNSTSLRLLHKTRWVHHTLCLLDGLVRVKTITLDW